MPRPTLAGEVWGQPVWRGVRIAKGEMPILVTGGGGFLGNAIVDRLLQGGEAVRSFARGDYPGLRARGVDVIRGDLADARSVFDAVRGCDLVFHVAAKVGFWGRHQDYHRTNVLGTQHVLDACRRHGVARLVHTSSPAVVFVDRDMEGVDESAPYPPKYAAAYPETKAEAERLVLHANCDTLTTVALRPHLMWGPGDTQLVPRLLEYARAGKLRFVGDGSHRVDSLYIDNAAEAHLQAAERLAPGSAVAGRAYFVTNGEPWTSRDLTNAILNAAGLPPVTRTVPPWAARWVGGVLELFHRVFRRRSEPAMTRYLASELSSARWFDISAARRDFGYEPRISIAEGLQRLEAWLKASEISEMRLKSANAEASRT